MEGLFVTGTDTGVGKTTVSMGLLKMLYGSVPVNYWKPIQTGTIVGDDTKDIQRVTEIPQDCFWPNAYSFAEPLAPAHAARRWHKQIDLQVVVDMYTSRRKSGTVLIAEGAGGVLVPLTPDFLQIDLMKKLGLPALIIAEDRLGAINHTLLTLRACREVGVPIAGVVLTRSVDNHGNKESIEGFGKVEVLAQIPPWENVHTLIGQVSCNTRLRQLFGLPPLPA